MQCELCGKEGNLVKSIVEGTELKVCQSCAPHGRVLESNKPRTPKDRSTIELLENVIPNAGELIKQKRESLNLSQKDFAKNVSEKESLISKIETGQITPSIVIARKLGKLLNLKLLETYEENNKDVIKKSNTQAMTIGDLLKK